MGSSKPTLLFDLDGTLADTAPDIVSSVTEAFESEGLDVDITDALSKAAGKGRMALIKAALKKETVPQELSDRLAKRFSEIYSRRMYETTTLFPGIKEMLKTLTAQNQSWGIVTNKLSDTGEPLLRWFGIWDDAGCVVFGDTLAVSKPSPEPLLYACQKLQSTPERCVMIGDTENDIRSGNAAGMTTIAVKHTYDEAVIMSWEPDIILTETRDVLQWFNNVEVVNG